MMKLISTSVQETLKIGRRIAHRLQKGDILCLSGELGSGKTTLIKGIAMGLGIRKDTIMSPTFVIMHSLRTRDKISFYHFDLYRLKKMSDILFLGYEEYLYGDGISVIEWPEKLGCLTPKEFLKIELSLLPDSKRLFRFAAFGKRYKELMTGFTLSRILQ